MRTLLIFAAVVELTSCSKKSAEVNQTVTPKEVVELSGPSWAAPVYTSLEVYINQYTLSPTQGAIGRPDLTSWNPDVKLRHAYSTNQASEIPHTAELEYEGTSSEGDHYVITITHPIEAGSESITKKVIYDGFEIELFRDPEYRIGIRPPTENEER